MAEETEAEKQAEAVLDAFIAGQENKDAAISEVMVEVVATAQRALRYEATIEELLATSADAVRVREGGGPEDLAMSLSVTFIKLRDGKVDAIAQAVEAAVAKDKAAVADVLAALRETGFAQADGAEGLSLGDVIRSIAKRAEPMEGSNEAIVEEREACLQAALDAVRATEGVAGSEAKKVKANIEAAIRGRG
jgi:hypothetical protein